MNMHKYNLSEGWIGEITLADQAFQDAKRRKTTKEESKMLHSITSKVFGATCAIMSDRGIDHGLGENFCRRRPPGRFTHPQFGRNRISKERRYRPTAV